MSDAPPASLHLTMPSDRRKRKRDRSAEHIPSAETEEKRRRIRQAGAMLFVERGVSGFGMSTLARQTKVSPSSMPYLYGKREELLADLVSRHVYELSQAVCAAYDATGTAAPRARLEAMLRGFLDAALADRHSHTLAMHALCALTERDRGEVRLRWRILFETLADPLLALAPACEENPRRVAMLAMAVAASVGNMLLWFDGAEELDRAEHAKRLATMLVAGVKGEPAGTCDRLGISCARAWLLLGDR